MKIDAFNIGPSLRSLSSLDRQVDAELACSGVFRKTTDSLLIICEKTITSTYIWGFIRFSFLCLVAFESLYHTQVYSDPLNYFKDGGEIHQVT